MYIALDICLMPCTRGASSREADVAFMVLAHSLRLLLQSWKKCHFQCWSAIYFIEDVRWLSTTFAALLAEGLPSSKLASHSDFLTEEAMKIQESSLPWINPPHLQTHLAPLGRALRPSHTMASAGTWRGESWNLNELWPCYYQSHPKKGGFRVYCKHHQKTSISNSVQFRSLRLNPCRRV